MKKLAVIISHPIQYYSPLFKILAHRKSVQIKVFYTWSQAQEKVYDKKFGQDIEWDIPLLEGYEYTFVNNISKNPGSAKFNGLINPTLNKEIESWKADAILVFGWNHHSHFKAMRFFKGKVPVYFRGDSTLLDEVPGPKTILRRIWLSFVYRFIDLAFFTGTNNKNYYLKHGLKEKQLVFAPHAIDNNRFFDNNDLFANKAEARRLELGFSPEDIVFLFVGKFEAKKNPLLLIEAAKQFPQYKFLFVGNGDLEDEMKKKAGKNVLFLPFQNQSLMPVVYRLADVFILPSQGPGETWGLAVNEAMACGKPILVSDKVGCALDLIKNKDAGFIFKSNDFKDFTEKINSFENNLEKFGEQSLKIIKNWSFEKIAESVEKTLA